MTIGSLFSGIGGLEKGLEIAGLGPVLWQVECDPFCRRVLERHWPGATRFEDVCDVSAAELAPVDLICGGFPCQDVSSAGKGAGLAGERSGLWREFARIVGELRPSWVVVENVASGARRWVDAVVRDLGQLGYATLPVPLSAADVGAPHRRARIFLVAHAERESLRLEQRRRGGEGWRGAPIPGHDGGSRNAAHAHRDSEHAGAIDGQVAGSPPATDAGGEGLQGAEHQGASPQWAVPARRAWAADAMPKPALCRVDDGPAAWLHRNDRLRALGNAVVPQCAEVIGWVVRELAGAA